VGKTRGVAVNCLLHLYCSQETLKRILKIVHLPINRPQTVKSLCEGLLILNSLSELNRFLIVTGSVAILLQTLARMAEGPESVDAFEDAVGVTKRFEEDISCTCEVSEPFFHLAETRQGPGDAIRVCTLARHFESLGVVRMCLAEAPTLRVGTSN